jgi:polyphosphate kinase
VLYFENACQPEIYVSSADWMPRNFFRRIEIAFPIEDGKLRDQIMDHILATTLADNSKARFLDAKGDYHRQELPEGASPEGLRRSQLEFLQTVQAGAQIDSSAPVTRYPRVKLAPKPLELTD